MQRYIANTQLLVDRELLLEQLPKGCVTCEVGVAYGGFSRKIIDIVQPRMHYLIDSWSHAGRYDDEAFLAVLKEFKMELRTGRATLFRASSVEGISQLPDAGIDFLYIDTDHSYPTTKRELAAAQSKIAPGALLAGHDYTHGIFNDTMGVYVRYGVVQAVQEFMQDQGYALRYLTVEPWGTYSFALQQIQE